LLLEPLDLIIINFNGSSEMQNTGEYFPVPVYIIFMPFQWHKKDWLLLHMKQLQMLACPFKKALCPCSGSRKDLHSELVNLDLLFIITPRISSLRGMDNTFNQKTYPRGKSQATGE